MAFRQGRRVIAIGARSFRCSRYVSCTPNRVFSGLVLAGLLIASAMLLPYRRVLGTSGFLVAAVVAVSMVATILLTDRRPKRG